MNDIEKQAADIVESAFVKSDVERYKEIMSKSEWTLEDLDMLESIHERAMHDIQLELDIDAIINEQGINVVLRIEDQERVKRTVEQALKRIEEQQKDHE